MKENLSQSNTIYRVYTILSFIFNNIILNFSFVSIVIKATLWFRLFEILWREYSRENKHFLKSKPTKRDLWNASITSKLANYANAKV